MNDLKVFFDPRVDAKPLFGASFQELTGLMENLAQPAYRARQLYDALYAQRASSLDQITTLPTTLRATLHTAGYIVGLPELLQTARSIDGTERYLVRMADGETVETVWMPGGDGGERGDGTQAAEEEEHPTHDDEDYKRATICISSQVGCAVNCQFCLTAKLGIRRNLTPGEIAGQVAAVLNRHKVEVGRDRINLVFMGMGEPFLNYSSFMDAVRLLAGPMSIPESRMTVSTSGILPGIEQFAGETIRPKLAVSLNASNDVVRESIMPITRKWNIAALLEAISAVPLRPRERVTFEYVLLGGINDRREHADELIALLKNLRAKINLIVWNSGPDMPFHEPTPQDVGIFQRRLRDAGIPAFIRKPRGRDIYAACGQLKRTLEQPPLVEIATL
ncbi:23S rRNA (adenine(2503)-C(2))-methyltransferase RlmN [Tunturiibacter empetritectus]|uniref:Probable dual-specificity RNA methyltransferase RlmN n=1 Tax=Tunturiibacter lichenicola TaxID=2051959 RepID=A0A852VGW6_9BACT|nr:23S rRNA (adenine(2503)-C(2))-methyltransferase RlmN [Edaphobacter lichenicola]NYF89465.1 23S rRNA (adenine2503-C2)-methyltransferase [Edaphobacter lichenicola]